ncbi:MAG TPA: CBS domain-containing protein [Anaerolineaceae bacterium]
MDRRITLTQEQLDLIERFITAYNTVDHDLREKLSADNGVPFSQLIRDFAARYPRWTDQETLRMLGDLRNAVVHQREQVYEYLSVPVPAVVETMERIRDEFESPERVYPQFARDVFTFEAESRLTDVLRQIDTKGFSQFPIYRRGKFMGLLTENGITRWLAEHTTHVMTLIELEEVTALEVLDREEPRMNYKFIPRETTEIDAENFFVHNSLLEALLITHTGKSEEKLLGIITRWDVLKM